MKEGDQMDSLKANLSAGWHLENSYGELPPFFYTKMAPTPVASPKLVKLNRPLAEDLGLNPEALEGREGSEIFSGNRLPEGAQPLAQAYAGHQFGHFTMLGDGRAILLGEQITPTGERVDIQLKGAGRTPYSRGGDGRAALGPMLREYIISEAMDALGIPTTRSLAVVTTGERIQREMPLTGAILTRVAASHLRVGTFEYAFQWGGREKVKVLADYAIQRHYPHLAQEAEEERYLNLLKEVVKKQASLIAQWQLVGFIHGVMNTDNMTISGETIDYGPCAFMDTYNPATVFSSIDHHGRYAYGNQPKMGAWNLVRLAEALLPLIHPQEDRAVALAQDAITEFTALYHGHWLTGMGAKLGIVEVTSQDEFLMDSLLTLMEQYKADYTNTFRALTLDRLEGEDLFKQEPFLLWHKKWQDRLQQQQVSKETIQEEMKKVNPSVIPRNHRVEEALEAAVSQNDTSVMEKLLEVLGKPFAYSPDQEPYTTYPAPGSCHYRTFCGT